MYRLPNPRHSPAQAYTQAQAAQAYTQAQAAQAYTQAQPPGLGQSTSFAGTSYQLSPEDMLYLRQRALFFTSILSQTGAGQQQPGPPSSLLTDGETRVGIAHLVASALFGNDYDFTTGQPMVGWTSQAYIAAYNYVLDGIVTWAGQAWGFPPVPTPPPSAP